MGTVLSLKIAAILILPTVNADIVTLCMGNYMVLLLIALDTSRSTNVLTMIQQAENLASTARKAPGLANTISTGENLLRHTK